MAYDRPRVRRVPPPPPPGFGDEEYYRLYGRPEDYHRYRQKLEEEHLGRTQGPPRGSQARPHPDDYYDYGHYRKREQPDHYYESTRGRGPPRVGVRPVEDDATPELSSLEEEDLSPRNDLRKSQFENFRVTIRNESDGTPSLSGMEENSDISNTDGDISDETDSGGSDEELSDEDDDDLSEPETATRQKSVVYSKERRTPPSETQPKRISVKDRLGVRNPSPDMIPVEPRKSDRRQDDKRRNTEPSKRPKSPNRNDKKSPNRNNRNKSPVKTRRRNPSEESRSRQDRGMSREASTRSARSSGRDSRARRNSRDRNRRGDRTRSPPRSKSARNKKRKVRKRMRSKQRGLTLEKMQSTHKENELMLRRLARKRRLQPRTSESDKNLTLARLAGIEIPAGTLGLNNPDKKSKRDSSNSSQEQQRHDNAKNHRRKSRSNSRSGHKNGRSHSKESNAAAVHRKRREETRIQQSRARNNDRDKGRNRSRDRDRRSSRDAKRSQDRTRDRKRSRTSSTPPPPPTRGKDNNSRSKSPSRFAKANASRNKQEARNPKAPRRGEKARRRSPDRIKVSGMESTAAKSRRSRILLSRSVTRSRSREGVVPTQKKKATGGGGSPDKWQHDKFHVGLLTPDNGEDERAFGSHWSKIRSERSKERDRRTRSRSSSGSRRSRKRRRSRSSSYRSRRRRSYSSYSGSSRSSSYSITSSSSGSVRRERRRHKAEKKAEMEAAVAAGLPLPDDNILPTNPEEPSRPDGVNFGLSGKLTEDTNTVNGVVVKYSEPPEAKKPKTKWRLYVFKGDEELPILYIHRQSAFLLGRDRKVADIPLDHPSCSKQHAALQYRLVEYIRPDGSRGRRVTPYVIDLESANGTFVNNQKIEPRKYVQVIEKDVIKFGFSSREYVLLHDQSKEIDGDDLGVE